MNNPMIEFMQQWITQKKSMTDYWIVWKWMYCERLISNDLQTAG